MFSWIIFLFLRSYDVGRPFPGRIDRLLVYSDTTTSERVILFIVVISEIGFFAELSGFNIVQRRSKVDINIGFNNANGIILIFRLDLQDVDLKLLPENFDCYGILLMEASKVSQLVL